MSSTDHLCISLVAAYMRATCSDNLLRSALRIMIVKRIDSAGILYYTRNIFLYVVSLCLAHLSKFSVLQSYS